MKVVGYLPLYPPSSRVGAWLATHEFLAELVRRGHDVDVFTYRIDGDYEHDGVRVHGRSERLGEWIAGADAVVSHLGGKGTAARLAAEAGVPSVRMVHGVSSEAERELSLFPPALVVFNAHHVAEATGWDGASIVAHPPVHGDRFRTAGEGDRVTLVSLTEEKGGHVFRALAREMPNTMFLAVKGGYGRQLAPTLPNVDVVETTENMRDDVYARTRVLLMPSSKESWGMTAVEAMHSGIPVIAAPTPGLIESLGDAGIFVDPRDIDAWHDEVNRLADPDEWAEASERARARAAELDPKPDLERFAVAVGALAS